MKIFLCNRKSKRSLSAKTVFASLLTFLLVSLISSQGYMFFSSKVMPVSLTEAYPVQENTISLKASGGSGADEAVIYVDGEEYGTFGEGEVQLQPGKSCVVEVLAGEGANFRVEAVLSGEAELVSGNNSVHCTEGMNFICRCYCPE